MTDAIVPTDLDLTRSTELPEQDEQIKKEEQLKAAVHDIRLHPGWPEVEAKFEHWLEKYKHPTFDPSMPLEDIGKQALMSQTMAAMLEEVWNDIRG